MPVQDFECQISRNQIGRYLNGEALSNEALRQLGSHVAECISCKGYLDQRKAALQGMLGEADIPVRVETTAPKVSPSEALIAQIQARSERDAQEAGTQDARGAGRRFSTSMSRPKALLTKPLFYCGALAVVLIGMTFITRNPSAILGPKASANPHSIALTSDSKGTIRPALPSELKKAPPPEKANQGANQPDEDTHIYDNFGTADIGNGPANDDTMATEPVTNAEQLEATGGSDKVDPAVALRKHHKRAIAAQRAEAAALAAKQVSGDDSGGTQALKPRTTKAVFHRPTRSLPITKTKKPIRRRSRWIHRTPVGTGTIHVYKA